MPDARRIPADSPDALALVDAMVAELSAIYPHLDQGTAPSATPADFTAPAGGFVGLYDGETAVAGGGVKRLDAATGEIKRMYVAPDRRGQGLARALLVALEALAVDLGYRSVRLDTGPAQTHARALYVSAGYSEIGNYNANPYASYWGEKLLT